MNNVYDDEEEIQKIVNRISRSIGHLESVKKMLLKGEDCNDVLVQLSAVRAAVSGAAKELLKHYINHSIAEAVKNHEKTPLTNLSSAIDKFIK